MANGAKTQVKPPKGGPLQRTGRVADKTLGAAGKGTAKVAKKFPVVAAVAGGAAAGMALRGNFQQSHPAMYDGTPNKGRSEDKHPYSGAYYG